MAEEPFEWDRRRKEGFKAFAAFQVYLDLGSDRSVRAVAAKVGKSVTLIGRWSARNGWVARSFAYDTHTAAVDRAGRDKARAKRAMQWEQRRIDMAEGAYELGALLQERAKSMLGFPIVETETESLMEDGITVIRNTTKPAKWNMATIAAMAKIGVEVAALAVQSHNEVDDGFDPRTATLEENRAWLEKQGVDLS